MLVSRIIGVPAVCCELPDELLVSAKHFVAPPFTAATVKVGSVTPAWKLLSVKLPLPPLLNVGWLHQTAWEKLIVTLEAPTAPDAETMVGAPVGELVASLI